MLQKYKQCNLSDKFLFFLTDSLKKKGPYNQRARGLMPAMCYRDDNDMRRHKQQLKRKEIKNQHEIGNKSHMRQYSS
jgi:hypothetical protein